MSALPALAGAVAAAAAAHLCFRTPAGLPRPDALGRDERVPQDQQARLVRWRPVLAGLVAVAGWAVVGGGIGVLAGAVAAAVAWSVLGRAESPATRRRREELQRDLPTAVDLLATVLRSGSSLERALEVVARAVSGPVGEELSTVGHRLALGVDPRTVWRVVAEHPELGPFGRAALRAHETGAPVAAAVHRLGDELRAGSRAEVEARAKGVEVRAAAPLGVCFLPAFVLLGVVPLVAGLFSTLRLF
ncbi:MAG TPA: type II secretion system F family protein [Marmoricola sp.]|nr:type II secretion system F family protein [Marmoricola sp.]